MTYRREREEQFNLHVNMMSMNAPMLLLLHRSGRLKLFAEKNPKKIVAFRRQLSVIREGWDEFGQGVMAPQWTAIEEALAEDSA